MRVVFMGMLDFLVLVLEVLVVVGYEIVVVYCQLLCLVGCGKKLCFMFVYVCVEVLGFEVCYLESLKIFEF